MRAPVILRVVTGRVPPGALDAVVEAYRRDYVPRAAATAGLDHYVVAARPSPEGGHEIAAMTLWTTVDAALAAYEGDLTAPRTLDGLSHGEALTGVDYYEIGPGGARRRAGSGAPSRLRLTAGTVARGLDADIQQELRRRLSELPDEALDAFVGRRVLGAEVEIALVTTWSGTPDSVDLEAPLWPSISGRYSTFRIGVHDVLLDGAGLG
jgi:hypothetical protein